MILKEENNLINQQFQFMIMIINSTIEMDILEMIGCQLLFLQNKIRC
jgi:hypothetical protein